MTYAVSRLGHSNFDLINHQPGFTAFWTLLRQARLCPNCEAVFDSSYTYCPCCGSQHLFDTIPLGQVLNNIEMCVDEHGSIERHVIKNTTLQAYQDELLRTSICASSSGRRFSVWNKTETEMLPGFFGLIGIIVRRLVLGAWRFVRGEKCKSGDAAKQ